MTQSADSADKYSSPTQVRRYNNAFPNTLLGYNSYLYNAFGEMTRQTNALNQQTNMSYDRLGRMLRRIDADGTDAAWIYDTATKGLGQLHIEDIEQGAATPLRRTYGYDRFARPSTVTTEIRRGASVQT